MKSQSRGPKGPARPVVPLQTLTRPGVPGTHDLGGLSAFTTAMVTSGWELGLNILYCGARTGHIPSTPNFQEI